VIAGVKAVFRKELKEYRRELAGSWTDLAPLVVGLLSTGVVLPLVLAPVLLAPGGMPTATALIAGSFVATLAADSFAGERERQTMEVLLASPLSDPAIVLGKISALVVVGVGMGCAFFVLGYAVLAGTQGEPAWSAFTWWVVPAALFGASALATLVAAIGVGVSLRAASLKQAQQTLGSAVMALLFGPLVASWMVPDSWIEGIQSTVGGLPVGVGIAGLTVGLLTLDALAVGLALARFRRSRMICL